MVKINLPQCILCTCCILLSLPLFAQKMPIALGINIGTIGLGLDVATNISPSWTAKVGYNYMDLNFAKSPIAISRIREIEDKVVSDYNFLQSNVSLQLGYSPFKDKDFRFLLGATYVYQNEINGSFYLDNDVQVNDVILTPQEVGTIEVRGTSANKLMPMFGFGFGRYVPKTRFNVNFELGALYRGRPEVDINATGLLINNDSNEAIIYENMKSYQWYPFLNIRLAFRIIN